MADSDQGVPSFGSEAFYCLHSDCGVYAHHVYKKVFSRQLSPKELDELECHLGAIDTDDVGHAHVGHISDTPFVATICQKCKKASIWRGGRLAHPLQESGPKPNHDMPDSVLKDYIEASAIAAKSPRAAAALLRLAVEKLCHLAVNDKSKSLNDCIKQLVTNGGFSEHIQKAADVVRVVGNNAVHPGVISLDDDLGTVNSSRW